MRQVIRCQNCQDLIMVFREHMVPFDKIKHSNINQMLGQVPWPKGAAMLCKKCGKPFDIQSLRSEEAP